MEGGKESLSDPQFSPQKRAFKMDPIYRLTHLQPEKVEDVLKTQRRKELNNAIHRLKNRILVEQRCFVCTLPIPCKHFKTVEEAYEAEPDPA